VTPLEREVMLLGTSGMVASTGSVIAEIWTLSAGAGPVRRVLEYHVC
jgi:hypothetical protein